MDVWLPPSTPEIEKQLRGFLRRNKLTANETMFLLYQVEQILAYKGCEDSTWQYIKNLLVNQGWESELDEPKTKRIYPAK